MYEYMNKACSRRESTVREISHCAAIDSGASAHYASCVSLQLLLTKFLLIFIVEHLPSKFLGEAVHLALRSARPVLQT